MPVEKITSTSNSRIKELVALQHKSSLRRELGVFTVEGVRELGHCVEAGFEVLTLFVCGPVFSRRAGGDTLLGGLAAEVVEVSREVYGKIACREGTEGVIALVRMPQRGLSTLSLGDDPLLLVVESVEKPGNLGAMLRSADAAGVNAVVVCDPLADIYNPNVVRSSIGAVFTVPCVATTTQECIAFLKERGITILTAQLQDSRPYYRTPMSQGTAIVVGTEATGLTEAWRQAADAHIRIPMCGKLDSLNVSTSAAILLFEAVRQRQADEGDE